MSEFMYLFRATGEAQEQAMGTPERAQRSLERWFEWIRQLEAAGALKNPGQPLSPAGKTVRGKDKVITDGPFVEAKDMVIGFLTVQAPDIDRAIALAASCPIVEGGGSVEIRPIMTLPA